MPSDSPTFGAGDRVGACWWCSHSTLLDVFMIGYRMYSGSLLSSLPQCPTLLWSQAGRCAQARACECLCVQNVPRAECTSHPAVTIGMTSCIKIAYVLTRPRQKLWSCPESTWCAAVFQCDMASLIDLKGQVHRLSMFWIA